MKRKLVYKIIFLFILFSIYEKSYGNTNTKDYCIELRMLAKTERLNKNYIQALEILEEAEKLAEQKNWTDLKIDIYNERGVTYKSLLYYDKAMECYMEAYKIALKESDKKKEAFVINNIAELYFYNMDFPKATEYFEKAYKLAVSLNDSLLIGKMASNLANSLHGMGDIDLADKYVDRSLKILNKEIYPSEFITSQIVKANILYLQKKYTDAEQLGLDIWNEIEETDHMFKTYFILLLSKIYQRKGDIKKAIHYAHQSLDSKPDLKDQIEIYQQLSDLYRMENTCSLALQYKDSLVLAMDSLSKVRNKDFLENSIIHFQLFDFEKKLAENQAKQKAERILFSVIFISVIVILFVIFWIFRLKSIKNKQRKIFELEIEKSEKRLLKQQLKEKETLALLEQECLNNDKLRLEQQLKEREATILLEQERSDNEKLLLEEKIKKQEAVALLEQERLNNEIDTKNRQITARILSQSNKNQLIEEILKTLPESGNKVDADTLSSIRRKLKIELKESSELNSFLVHFEQINPELFSFLKKHHPNLTTNDILLLSYIYLNLNIKEIASLLNITPDYCKKKKQRLARKMGIQAKQLHDYLTNIS